MVSGSGAGVGGNQDVGGSAGSTNVAMAIHGGRAGDQQLFLDGMRFNNILGQAGGGAYTIYINTGSIQEISLTTDHASAESETGGIRFNIIPKEGGNTFTGYFFTDFTNSRLQGDNLTPAAPGPRHHRGQRHRQDLGRQSGLRRPDPAGQAVVLHGPSVVGQRQVRGGGVLQREPAGVDLHARFEPAGGG